MSSAKHVNRMSYLRRQLIGDPRDCNEIFVHLGSDLIESEDMRRLRAGLRSTTPAPLLTMTAAERPTDVSRVEAVGDGCLGGGSGGWDIDFSGWLSVCRAAVAHWQTEASRAESVA